MRRDDLDELLLVRTPRFLDERRRRQVPRLPLLLGECLVGDPLHQVLHKAVLPPFGRARISLQRQDLLANQGSKQLVEVSLRPTGQRGQALLEERLAQDRGVLDQPSFVRAEPVQPGSDERVEATGNFQALDRTGRPVHRSLPHEELAVQEHPNRLHRVQRHPLGPLQDPRLQLRWQPGHKALKKLVHRRVRQGLQGQRRGVPGGAPRRPAIRKLGPGQRQHEDGVVLRPLEQIFDEVEEPLVRPLHVLEDQDHRSAGGHPFDEQPPGGEDVLPGRRALALFEPQQVAQPRLQPARLRLVLAVARDGLAELGDCGRLVFAFYDPGPHPDHLRERPVRDPFTVGEAPAPMPKDAFGQAVNVLEELPLQPRLAQAGHADDGDEVRRPLLRRRMEQILDHPKLATAAGERRLQAGGLQRSAPQADHANGPPQRDRSGLALELVRAGVFVHDGRLGGRAGRLSDEDGARLRRRLDPGGGVHHVAGDQPLPLGVGSHRRLTGQDARSRPEGSGPDLFAEG